MRQSWTRRRDHAKQKYERSVIRNKSGTQQGTIEEMLAVEGEQDDGAGGSAVDGETFAQLCHKYGIYLFHDGDAPGARALGVHTGAELCGAELGGLSASLDALAAKLKIGRGAAAPPDSDPARIVGEIAALIAQLGQSEFAV